MGSIDGQTIPLDNSYHIILRGANYDLAHYGNLLGGNGVNVNLDSGTTLMEGREGVKDYLGNAIVNVTGSDYNDTITGNDFNNVLVGGSGDDIIKGGKGNDVLTGGSGSDTFIFTSGDSGYGIDYREIISDVELGIDKIDLSAFAGGAFIGSDSFSGAVNQVRAEIIGGNTILQIDTDGDSAVDMEIELTGEHFFDSISREFDGVADGRDIPPWGNSSMYGTNVGELLEGTDSSNGVFARSGDDTI